MQATNSSRQRPTSAPSPPLICEVLGTLKSSAFSLANAESAVASTESEERQLFGGS